MVSGVGLYLARAGLSGIRKAEGGQEGTMGIAGSGLSRDKLALMTISE
jgi:hypothetical protein